MRWPWQAQKPDPTNVAIADHQVENDRVLRRVRRVLSEAVGPGSQAERRLVDDYTRADRERRQ